MGPDPTGQFDILILGPIPPPFGGISVHLSRLVPILEEAGFTVAVLNHFESADMRFVVGVLNRNPLRYYRLPKRFPARIVHYHHSRWVHLVAVALGKRNSDARYVMTLHAGDIQKHFPQLTSRVPCVSRLTHWALRRFETVIAVDPTIGSILRSHLDGQHVEVLPAFLESGDHESRTYEPPVEAFLRAGRVVVVAAYGVQFLPDGGELYGLDTAVEAFTTLAADRQDLRLALFIARRPSARKARRHLAKLERRLEEGGVRDRTLIVFGLPLVPALRQNTIFLRPTRAEGDAVSVREALQARVPVLASDVVPRPAGVVSFPVGNVEELCRMLADFLNDPPAPTSGFPGSGNDALLGRQFLDGLISIYRTELERSTLAASVQLNHPR
jgi:glycosyltransferase involved in cell wall biosynthesis